MRLSFSSRIVLWQNFYLITTHPTSPFPDGRKAVQERTFTRWMNVFLQRRVPPLKVCDLFTDIQDGRMLMALLEELSGCRLLYRFRSSSHRIFRLNNISKALAFLDDRHVSLLGIDASAIADGNPSVVLSLVWNIILHFQVGNWRHLSSSLSSISLSAYPSSSDLSPQTSDSVSYTSNTLPRKGKKATREQKYHSKTIKSLLHWVQRCTSKYGVDVDDFGASWRSGLAFLALIKSINPDLVDLRENLSKEPRENIQQAFMVAHQFLDIPPLLEPEDCTSPDEQSIITYVSMFLGRHSVVDEVSATSKALDCNSNKSVSPETSFPSSQRVLEPPSPLEAGVTNQEIRSWMDKEYGKKRVHGSHVSQSFEEGTYSLSVLDSDEEDAYTYILDLNKDVFQPNNPPKRQVPKVEEETAEEMEEESKHLEALGMFNGGRRKQQGGPLSEDTDFNPESAIGAQSAAHRKFDLDKKQEMLLLLWILLYCYLILSPTYL
uniref:Calmin n=1 Tax=Fundulus heteroclitus TaxID=8078 RepID=A0A3Q2UQW9_FUNHE